MKTTLLGLVILVVASLHAVAGGSFVVADKLAPLLHKTPVLEQYVTASLDLEPGGMANRIGQIVNPNLGGTRVGPYVVRAKRKGAKGASTLQIKFITETTFLDSDGRPATLQTGTQVTEIITSVDISLLTKCSNKFVDPIPEAAPKHGPRKGSR
jgi:hypothetical protein